MSLSRPRLPRRHYLFFHDHTHKAGAANFVIDPALRLIVHCVRSRDVDVVNAGRLDPLDLFKFGQALRALEPSLAGVRLGGQYVLGERR